MYFVPEGRYECIRAVELNSYYFCKKRTFYKSAILIYMPQFRLILLYVPIRLPRINVNTFLYKLLQLFK